MNKTIKTIATLFFIWVIIPDEMPNQSTFYESFKTLEENARLLYGKDSPEEWALLKKDYYTLLKEYDEHLIDIPDEHLQSISLSIVIIESCFAEASKKTFISSYQNQ